MLSVLVFVEQGTLSRVGGGWESVGGTVLTNEDGLPISRKAFTMETSSN